MTEADAKRLAERALKLHADYEAAYAAASTPDHKLAILALSGEIALSMLPELIRLLDEATAVPPTGDWELAEGIVYDALGAAHPHQLELVAPLATAIAAARRAGAQEMRERCEAACEEIADRDKQESASDSARRCKEAIHALPLSGDKP